MGLVLYSGYYDKEKALSILSNLKYYKRNLELCVSDEDLCNRTGLIPYLYAREEKMHEDFIVEKMRMVKSVLAKQGNEAIDAYQQLTSPNENHHLQPMKRFFAEENWLTEILDDLSIPMKKDEFEHYLDIFNKFFGKNVG